MHFSLPPTHKHNYRCKIPSREEKWYRDEPTLLKPNVSNISSSCWAPISVCLPSVIIINLVLTLSDPKAVYGTTKKSIKYCSLMNLFFNDNFFYTFKNSLQDEACSIMSIPNLPKLFFFVIQVLSRLFWLSL